MRSDPTPGIAHVGKDHFARAARRNHLVVDQVWCGAGERQILLSLADHFMPRSKWDEMCESCRVDNITIVHIVLQWLLREERVWSLFFSLVFLF